MTSKASEPNGIVVTPQMIRAGLDVVKSCRRSPMARRLAAAYRAMAAAAPPDGSPMAAVTPTMLQALRLLGHKLVLYGWRKTATDSCDEQGQSNCHRFV